MKHFLTLLAALLLAFVARADDARIVVHADWTLFTLSDMMIGANMEDLHYQMVGGFDSQMLHGESFYEHSPTELAPLRAQLDGFANVNGAWSATNGVASVHIQHGGGTPWHETGVEGGMPPAVVTNTLDKDAGTRITSLAAAPADTVETRASFCFATNDNRVVSLISHVHPNHSDNGWNWYSGYTIELDPKANTVRLLAAQRAAKHSELAKAAVKIPRDTWLSVALRVTGTQLVVCVNHRDVLTNGVSRVLPVGHFGIVARGPAQVRDMALVSASGRLDEIPFRENPLLTTPGDALSLRWARVQTGSAQGVFAFDPDGWHPDLRSQEITFGSGAGDFGCDNAGLKRGGLSLCAGRNYEGFLRVKAAQPTECWVSLRKADGTVLAEQRLEAGGSLATGHPYQRISFSLTPSASDGNGRFAITLRKPGRITVGYAFLQPGEWGRFKGLPVRKDLAEALIAQGIRVLRFNGGMIEVPGYRWKNLRGPRDERPPYNGFYDRYCSSGFGPAEAVAFGKAAGLPVIPALNLDETPEAVADFVSTCKPSFYQVANESRFDRRYVDIFKRVAEAVWKVAPETTLITTSTRARLKDNEEQRDARAKLALQLELAAFAKEHGKKIIFDSHSFNGAAGVQEIATFARWLNKLAPDPKLVSVGILEFNAGAFDVQRGLNHALEMNAAYRHGDVIRGVGTPNVSQPWGIYQSDWKAVLWTQGNIYYTPNQVWFQTAYYVDQMIAASWAPEAVSVEAPATLDVFAAKTADGAKLVLRVVNNTANAQPADLDWQGVARTGLPVCVTTLAHADPLDSNTERQPKKIKPVTTQETSGKHLFPPCSFTVIEIPIKP